MMTKNTSKKMLMFKKIALIPILTGMMYLFCVETIAQKKDGNSKVENQKSNVSDDKKRDIYFKGVRFKVYKNGYSTKNKTVGKDLVMDKTYEELSPEDKVKYKVWLLVPKATVKKSPTKAEMEDYKNSKKYAIWIDGKNVPNTALNKYNPQDIASFSGSSVLKNARTKQHPQPFQFWFYTHPYFDKNEMGKQAIKYHGDQIEIFENFQKKIITQKTLDKIEESSVVIGVDEKIEQQSEELIYNQADKKPDFPGGIMEFYSFVGKNFKVPEAKVNGKVFIQFVVEKDGSLTDIKVLRDIGHGTGEEAIRVLKLSPKWIPGEQDGKKVRVLYSLPISIQS